MKLFMSFHDVFKKCFGETFISFTYVLSKLDFLTIINLVIFYFIYNGNTFIGNIINIILQTKHIYIKLL